MSHPIFNFLCFHFLLMFFGWFFTIFNSKYFWCFKHMTTSFKCTLEYTDKFCPYIFCKYELSKVAIFQIKNRSRLIIEMFAYQVVPRRLTQCLNIQLQVNLQLFFLVGCKNNWKHKETSKLNADPLVLSSGNIYWKILNFHV